MFVGAMVSNFGTYLYYLFMGRMLGPVGYGALESLISLWYILSVVPGALGLVIIKFTSQFLGEGKRGAIVSLFRFFSRFGVVLGGTTTLFLFLISPLLTSFLRLPEISNAFLTATLFLMATLLLFNRSFLQGLLKFKENALNGILETTLKLLLAIILVSLGFYINGAILAIFLAGMVAYLASFIPLKIKEEETVLVIDKREILHFAFPSFIFTFCFMTFFSIDVILVKHFFSPREAGLYAALSVLGKIVYFAVAPIVSVMFPLISKARAEGKSFGKLLPLTLGLVMAISLGITGIYFLLPKLMIMILFGPAYVEVSSLVWLMGIFLTFYSFSYTLTSFYLSLKKVKILSLPLLALVVEIGFLWFFHASLLQVITILIAISGLLSLGLLLYYPQVKA